MPHKQEGSRPLNVRNLALLKRGPDLIILPQLSAYTRIDPGMAFLVNGEQGPPRKVRRKWRYQTLTQMFDRMHGDGCADRVLQGVPQPDLFVQLSRSYYGEVFRFHGVIVLERAPVEEVA